MRTQYDLGNFAVQSYQHEEMQRLWSMPESSGARGAKFCRTELAQESSRETSYYDGELFAELLGLNGIEHRWAFELMRAASAVMTFHTSAIVLVEQPTLKLNADGDLHCDDGPAVFWSDGAAQYYVDGHALGPIGYKIIEAPSTITLNDINNINNEEVRRIAIERFGWSRYLREINAHVVDQRQNDVDNTVEALISIPQRIVRQTGWGSSLTFSETVVEQRRLILACRSTGRQYFLNVPNEISSCIEGQRWLNSGANTQHIPEFNRPLRLLGAS